MKDLHLFAGCGGGILADPLLGHMTVGAVEIEDYPVKVLKYRMINNRLNPPFPVYRDVRNFRLDNPECGRFMKWLKDDNENLIISGGFPCQDISSAGKGEGITGERSGLWKEYKRIVGEIRPAFVFIENSPLLTSRGLDVVLMDLFNLGYDAEWIVLGADDVGAPHKRKRIWILATRKKTFKKNGNFICKAADGEWVKDQKGLFSENIPFVETFPKCGSMRRGVVFENQSILPDSDILKEAMEEVGVDGFRRDGTWPTPTTMDSLPPKSEEALKREAEVARPGRSRPSNLRDCVHPEQLKKWPTPRKFCHKDSNYDRGKSNLGEVVGEHERKRFMWPTPTVAEATKIPATANYGQIGLNNHPRIRGLPTRGKLVKSGKEKTFPTPGTTGTGAGSGSCRKIDRLHEDGIISEEERKSMRNGHGGTLSPDWIEWLMGWPVGYTDISKEEPCFMEWSPDPADLPEESLLYTPRIKPADDLENRVERIKGIGNGQVPRCVAVAQIILLKLLI